MIPGPGRGRRAGTPVALAVVAAAFAAEAPAAPPLRAAAGGIGFSGSALAGAAPSSPTSLQWGPDGRLYVAELGGRIRIHDVERVGRGEYRVLATETLDHVRDIPNRDDRGVPEPAVTGRQVTGLLVAGSAEAPEVYVTSSDPRMGEPGSGVDPELDTNSGILSRLTRSGGGWTRRDLVRGLPRSEDNHATNGMALDPATRTLYVAQGGHTNMGAPSVNFALQPEYALSAAILAVDLDAIGDRTHDLPTLDDETRPNSGPGGADLHDPFGGNDGRNQARLVPGGPVRVHAAGLRNPYDVVWTADGRLYTVDNGPTAGGGGPPTDCTHAAREPGVTHPDNLHRVVPGAYLGHPNPTRASRSNTFNAANPQSPVAADNPVECEYRAPGADGSWITFPSSTNGLAEYRGDNFGGAMRGDLLAVGFDGTVWRLKPNPAGTGLEDLDGAGGRRQALFTGFGSLPLDVATLGPDGPFPGTVWIAVFGANAIVAFEPDDYGGGGSSCTRADDPGLDEDGDGYSNADELDNGTDPCSAASVPPDRDGDLVSNLNDPDDDGDGRPDHEDPFAADPANGADTRPPVAYRWGAGDPPAGGLLGLGFTGLMSDGVTDYEALFDPTRMTAGGAPGMVTVDEVPEGDARGGANTQRYAFQLGVATEGGTGRLQARTRLVAPFAGGTPEDFQAFGLYVGNGTQDDYVKIVACANGGSGGIEVGREIAGAYEGWVHGPADGVAILGAAHVDLALTVDAGASAIEPAVRTGAGPWRPLPRVDVPAGWIPGVLAVGILATSRGPAPPFAASWDWIEVSEVPPVGASGAGRAPLHLAAPSPNPFSAGTALAFQLPFATRASLDLFDLAGARVRRLVDEPLAAGDHRVTWDGRDERGDPVPPGLYLARLRSGPDHAVRRVVCVR